MPRPLFLPREFLPSLRRYLTETVENDARYGGRPDPNGWSGESSEPVVPVAELEARALAPLEDENSGFFTFADPPIRVYSGNDWKFARMWDPTYITRAVSAKAKTARATPKPMDLKHSSWRGWHALNNQEIDERRIRAWRLKNSEAINAMVDGLIPRRTSLVERPRVYGWNGRTPVRSLLEVMISPVDTFRQVDEKQQELREALHMLLMDLAKANRER